MVNFMRRTENLTEMWSAAVPVDSALKNKLLAALPESDWERLQRHLSAVEAPAGKTLCESHGDLGYA
jgi:hypothetical protein